MEAEVQHTLGELVERGTRAIVSAIDTISQRAAEAIADEAPQGATGKLSSPWQIEEADPLTRVLRPDPDAWYAHIVARGRGPVAPRRARALTIPGVGFRRSAGPVAANPFHERGIASAQGDIDDALRRALAEEGL